jgi:integrase
VRSLEASLESAHITNRPILRSLDRLSTRPERQAVGQERGTHRQTPAPRALGWNPARYAGHSLRAGLATSAAAAGASERVITAQTGHRSADMVRRYTREGYLWRENAASLAGL